MVVAGRLSNWIRGICQSELLFLFEGNIGGNWKYEISFTLGLNKRVRGISPPPTYDAVLATDYRQRDHPCYCLWSHSFCLWRGPWRRSSTLAEKQKQIERASTDHHHGRPVCSQAPSVSGVFLGRFIRYCSSFEVPRQQRELLYNTRHTHPHFFEKIVIGGKGQLADSMASEDGKLGVVSLELCWTEHGKTASTLPNSSSSSATTNYALTLVPSATITLRH